jgi:hypothetical protein
MDASVSPMQVSPVDERFPARISSANYQLC